MATEHLALSQKLNMNLQFDYGLVVMTHFSIAIMVVTNKEGRIVNAIPNTLTPRLCMAETSERYKLNHGLFSN